MRLNEVAFDNRKPIEGYGPNFFRIDGDVYEGPTTVFPSGIRSWSGFDDHASLVAMANEVDVIFVGTGAEIAHMPTAFREALEEAGVGLEPMSSPAACRTYNVLLSEGRRIGLALLPV